MRSCQQFQFYISAIGEILSFAIKDVHRNSSKLMLLSKKKYYYLNVCNVSLFNTLSATFNSMMEPKLYFSWINNSTGLFQIKELSDYAGFYLLQSQVIDHVDDLVGEINSPNRTRKLVAVFDELSDCLCKVADLADFVRTAHPNRNVVVAAAETCHKLSTLVEQLNTNIDIYRALQKVVKYGDNVDMDCVDKRVANLFLFDFEQSGIHLNECQRQKFVELNDKIHMLSSSFQQGVASISSLPRSQLPGDMQHIFATNDNDNVAVNKMYSDHGNEEVRQMAYRLYLHPNEYQEDVLNSLLTARYHLAQLAGFKTYSARANTGTMMGSPDTVMDFLNLLSERLRPRSKRDIDEIMKLKKAENASNLSVQCWDLPYYTAVGRQKRCNIATAEVMNYLSLGCVMDGLNRLFTALYGISLHVQPMKKGESWHYDIHKLAVEHETEGVLGYIYCDFFEREGKPNQDCHYTICGGRVQENGDYQLPIVVLQLNFPSPTSSTPSLLTPGGMENLFHEFGHAMHSMMARTKYQHVTGTRCTTDFAEVPSVLMEFFANDPRVISSFARHYETNEQISESSINAICAAKNIFGASDMQQQTFYSVLDQVYHGPIPLPGPSTTSVLAHLQEQYSCVPYVPNTAWQLRFGHLVGYGARYYAYLVSRAIAAKIWHSCFASDPFSREMGDCYRKKMLQHGGGIHPSLLVQDMLGEKPTVTNLVDSLIYDLDFSQQYVHS